MHAHGKCRTLIVLAVVLGVGVACHDSPTAPPTLTFEKAPLSSGDLQSDTVLATLAPFRVVVRANGRAARDVTVHWTVTASAAASSTISTASTSVSDTAGIATLRLKLEPDVRDYTVEAKPVSDRSPVYGPPVTFTAAATPGHPVAIRLASGENQSDTTTTPLGADYVVQAVDGHGNPVGGVGVDWAVMSGGGSISPAQSVSASVNGYAAARHTLGPIDGAQAVTATASGLPTAPSVTFTSTGFTLGRLEITARTTGVELDSDGYALSAIRSGPVTKLGDVGANGTVTIPGVLPGDYRLMLGGLAANCDPADPSSRSITVPSGGTVAVEFNVTCNASLQLALAMTVNSNTDVYLMKTNGTGLTRLTTAAGFDDSPAWSPDGTRIAFQSERDGNSHIYVMNADGSGQVRLTSGEADVGSAWSPDGRKIAFQCRQGDAYDLCVMNADGSGQVRLTTNARDQVQEPKWSPDSRRIAFAQWQFTGGNAAIYVADADGSNLVRVTTSATEAAHPVWSPDGSRIAFSVGYLGSGGIYAMNSDGSAATQLSRNGAQPEWSPDGKKIVFVQYSDCDYYYYTCKSDLFVMNSAGSSVTRLTFEGASWGGSWSPDGRLIAYVASHCDYYDDVACGAVRLVRPDGTGLIELARGAAGPAWRR